MIRVQKAEYAVNVRPRRELKIGTFIQRRISNVYYFFRVCMLLEFQLCLALMAYYAVDTADICRTDSPQIKYILVE